MRGQDSRVKESVSLFEKRICSSQWYGLLYHKYSWVGRIGRDLEYQKVIKKCLKLVTKHRDFSGKPFISLKAGKPLTFTVYQLFRLMKGFSQSLRFITNFKHVLMTFWDVLPKVPHSINFYNSWDLEWSDTDCNGCLMPSLNWLE